MRAPADDEDVERQQGEQDSDRDVPDVIVDVHRQPPERKRKWTPKVSSAGLELSGLAGGTGRGDELPDRDDDTVAKEYSPSNCHHSGGSMSEFPNRRSGTRMSV
ncbi:hypothetical protein GCM10009741_10890 [Kribbella lupini]|uniref:Uncharacterized protein n=1 Tax=Kribbella lupini TaxID=291602 RepID=A0ABN2A9F3_9ACTN